MTRIRPNWSSSRGVKEPESPPLLPHLMDHESPRVVVTNAVDPDTEARRASQIQLQIVAESLLLFHYHILAAENYMLFQHDAVLAAERIRGHRALAGGLSRQGRSVKRSSKITSESDTPADSASNVRVPGKEVLADELQPRSSGIHDKVDSDISVGVEPVPILASGSKVDHLGLQTDKLEKRRGRKDSPIVAYQIVDGGGTRRKKRQRPWESYSDMALTTNHHKERKDAGIHNEGIGQDDRSTKLRAKSEKVMEDQGIRDGNKFKIEKARARKVSHGEGRKPIAKVKSEKRKVESQKVLAESLPLGSKYGRLAQIAEKHTATLAREDRCSRTDGRSWQCPLKRKDGFSLCEHHLIKRGSKQLYNSNESAKLDKSNGDTVGQTKFPRRQKTKKLSLL